MPTLLQDGREVRPAKAQIYYVLRGYRTVIRLMIRYSISTGEGVALASGGQLSGHADFINAWDQRALARLVDECFHDRPCNERP